MASGVSFSSLGSGIDFNVIRDAIITQRSRPVTRLQAKATEYSSRADSLKQLNAALATLTTAAEALTNRDLGAGKSIATSDAAVITASAASSASLGAYDLNVTRLATNLSQASRSFASVNDPVLAGGATTATFELRKGGATTGEVITIDSLNNTLASLRDAINAKNAGVTASIVDLSGDGTSQQLVLNSKDPGSSGRVQLVETTSTGSEAALTIRSLNPPDGDFTKLDASLTVNGLAITRSSNTIDSAIGGVSLTIKKTGSATIQVTTTTDVENKIRGFVGAYNAVQAFVAAQYKTDGIGRPTGVLAGDPTLRNVRSQLRDAVSAISSNGGALTSLADIGLTTSNDGTLAFDSAKLSTQLTANSDDVKALLFGKTSSDSGIFNGFHKLAAGMSDSITGSVQSAITGYVSSVNSLSKTIADRMETLNRLRDSLTKQYSVADAAIGQLNGQQTSLTNIMTSLQPKSNN